MSLLNKILLLILLFIFSDEKAASMQQKTCSSSVVINGMKIEFSNLMPIIVNRDTNRVIKNDKDYHYKAFQYPVVSLSFTALDRDIQWQRDLYEYSFNLAYKIGENEFENLGWFENPSPPDYENLVKYTTLKKGEKEQYFRYFLDLPFDRIYRKLDYKIFFTVSGELPDLNDAAPGSDQTNPYKGDKKIWQEPFKLCLEAEWQYK